MRWSVLGDETAASRIQNLVPLSRDSHGLDVTVSNTLYAIQKLGDKK